MANIKISELVSGSITESASIPASEGGSTVQVTPTQIAQAALVSINNQSSDYSFEESDSGNIVVSTSSTSVNFTLLDSSSFRVGSIIEVVQDGTGALTLIEGAGTTINRSRFATLTLGGQGSTVRLRKKSSGNWIASGDLKEEKPFIQFVPSGASASDFQPFALDTTKTFAQGGFSASSANSQIVAPIAGLYSVEFNFNVSVAAPIPDQYFAIINSDGAPYSNYATVINIESGSFTNESPLNWTQTVRVINAGSDIRLSFSSTGGSYTPDNSKDRQICSITWIGD